MALKLTADQGQEQNCEYVCCPVQGWTLTVSVNFDYIYYCKVK